MENTSRKYKSKHTSQKRINQKIQVVKHESEHTRRTNQFRTYNSESIFWTNTNRKIQFGTIQIGQYKSGKYNSEHTHREIPLGKQKPTKYNSENTTREI